MRLNEVAYGSGSLGDTFGGATWEPGGLNDFERFFSGFCRVFQGVFPRVL